MTAIRGTENSPGTLSNSQLTMEPLHIKDALVSYFRYLEKISETADEITGIPTGFIDLDRVLLGLHPSNLIIIAGRPSMGKTTFAQNIAVYISKHMESNNNILVFGLDMSKEQFASGMLISEARVDSSKIRKGILKPEDWDKVAQTIDTLCSTSIRIMDRHNISVESVGEIARKLKSEDGLDLIIIDYLQLMTLDKESSNGRNDIDEIIYELKCIAQDLNIPVLVISQLNRKLEKRADHRPKISDLSGSGYIDELADVILLLYRDEVYYEDSPDKGIAEIIIAKQKNGPTGVVRLSFIGKYLKFATFSRTEPE
jgi:replicative DNA helicase